MVNILKNTINNIGKAYKAFTEMSFFNKLSLILLALFFLFLIFSNIYLEKTDLFLGVDGNWKFSVKHSIAQEELLGRDVFFTYGPLAPYLLSSPIVSNSFLMALLPELFKLCLFTLIFYLIYRLTKFNVKSLLFLIPLSLFLSAGFFITFTDLVIEIALLLIILSINKGSINLSNRNIIYFAIFSSILLLFKFSLGIASCGVVFLLILFNAWNDKRELIKKIFIFASSLAVFTAVAFSVTACSANIIPYFLNSLALSGLYKEFMAVNMQTPSDYAINFILVFGLALNLLILKPKNYLAYIFLCYTAVLYGWVRNDGHIISTNAFILFSLVTFANSSQEKIPVFSKISAIRVYRIGLFLAGIFIVISYLHFLDYKIDLLKPTINLNFYKYPIWHTATGFQQTTEGLAKLRSQIPSPIVQSIQKDDSCLMVIPDKSAIPLALDKCQIHLAYLQLYSNYPENSDRLNIENLKRNYPKTKILFHDGAIDNRIYLSETPLFMLSIYKNFELERFEEGYLLLKPLNEKWQDVACLEAKKEDSNFLKNQVQYSSYQKIKSSLYKDPEICVEYTDIVTGQKIEKRTFQSQLERGIATKPFLSGLVDLVSFFESGREKNLKEFNLKKCGTDKSVTVKTIGYFSCY